MVDSKRRVVITGIGAVTPLGYDLREVWDALCAGRTGIRRLRAFDPEGLPTHLAAEVLDYDPKVFVSAKQRKSLKVMCRDTLLAIGAARLALNDAGLLDQTADLDRERIGVLFGATMMSSELEELRESALASCDESGRFDLPLWGERAPQSMPPLWMLKYLPNMPSCHVSILYDFQGPNNTITQEEAASTLAIGEAVRIIQRGAADVMVAGGAESTIHPLRIARLCLLGGVSRRNEEPRRASVPFDRDPGGIVPGEGAAVVVLEEQQHARRRGARIYGEVLGFGAACVAKPDLSWSVDPHACAAAMQRALEEAGMEPFEVGYYNAHGCAVPEADRAEAQALAALWGSRLDQIPVSAQKSNFGCAANACGALEFVVGILVLQHGLIPPIVGFSEPDPECPLRVVRDGPVSLPKPSFLKVSFSRVGQAAALLVRKEAAA
jgi:3-oxoacyl-[acyl-carrier-protein] synthase II